MLNAWISIPLGAACNEAAMESAAPIFKNLRMVFLLEAGAKGQHRPIVTQLQMQARQLDVESKQLTLWQNISQAYADAKAAVESYFANQKSYESAKQAFDVADKRYAVGMMSNLEFQQAKTNMLNAEAEVLKAKYTYIFKTKILDFYQGKPITLK